jgi:adenylate cyclase
VKSVLSRARLAFLIPVVATLAGLTLQLLDPPPLTGLRNSLFDQYQRWQPRDYRPVPVRIVDIDEESLKRLGQWPWPRTRVAELAERLREAGAAVIGFDLVFAEPDRSAPLTAMTQWRLSPAAREELHALPDHDRVLADSLRTGGVVLGTVLERSDTAQSLARRPGTRIATSGAGVPPLHAFRSEVRPLAELESAAEGLGALNFIPDSDGVVRRVPLALSLAGQAVPSFDAEILRVAQRAPNLLLRAAVGGELETARIGGHDIPVTREGEMWLRYSPRVAGRSLPAWKVLAGDFPRSLVAGNMVLVGTSAQGLLDLRFSPLGGIIPGVEIHAQALEQVLAGQHLARPYWAPALEAILLLVGGIASGVLALRRHAVFSAIATCIVLLLLGAGAWHLFAARGLLLDPLTPALAIVASFTLSGIVHHREAERRQRWMREAFSRYVSPNLVRHLTAHPDQLDLGGERRECSFVFTDLADFTRLMELTNPANAVALLNRYLDGMIGIAFRHEGTLDRLVGDAIAIMFSAPLTQADHRRRALACALEMRDFANRHRAELAAQGVAFGLTRIGVHCGEVIVGNLGGNAIFDYRALGDPVNTASRLETANKWLGTQVCVSQAMLDDEPAFAARPIGRLLLDGKLQPVMAWELLGSVPDANAEPDAPYAEAYALLATDTSAATRAFVHLRALRPDDALVRLHNVRLSGGESGDLVVLGRK